MQAFLYTRESPSVEPAATQERIVTQYWSQTLQPLGYEADSIFCDQATIKDTPFVDRVAGSAIHQRVQSGDAVVISSLPRGFDDIGDFGMMLLQWSLKKVSLHAVLDDLNTTQPSTSMDLARIVNRLVTWREARSSERQLQVMAMQKEKGKPVNGYAGYGYRWVGRRGNRTRVPDEKERQLMESIVRWRDVDKWSVEDVYHHLRREGIKTRRGTEWSRSRISRCYFAAKAES